MRHSSYRALSRQILQNAYGQDRVPSRLVSPAARDGRTSLAAWFRPLQYTIAAVLVAIADMKQFAAIFYP